MGNDIVLLAAQEAGYSDFQLDLIRNTAAKGCSDTEIAQLLYISMRTGLDPITRQIYMIKRRQQVEGKWVDVATPQTGIDGYRLIADRTGCYAPGKEPAFIYDGEGRLYSATAYVRKLVCGTWHEVAATAIYSEYVQTTKDGKTTTMWDKMPHAMLGKCAESLALRRAFPAELSGLYTNEEMGQADNLPAPTIQVLEAEEFDPDLAYSRMIATWKKASELGLDLIHPTVPRNRAEANTQYNCLKEDIRNIIDEWAREFGVQAPSRTVSITNWIDFGWGLREREAQEDAQASHP